MFITALSTVSNRQLPQVFLTQAYHFAAAGKMVADLSCIHIASLVCRLTAGLDSPYIYSVKTPLNNKHFCGDNFS